MLHTLAFRCSNVQLPNFHGLILACVIVSQNVGNWLHYQNHLGSFMNYTYPETPIYSLVEGSIPVFFCFLFLNFIECDIIFLEWTWFKQFVREKNKTWCLFTILLRQNLTHRSDGSLQLHRCTLICSLKGDLFKRFGSQIIIWRLSSKLRISKGW